MSKALQPVGRSLMREKMLIALLSMVKNVP